MFINNLAYKASAGSGKTFMLVVRYLSLLFLGANPSKILALTFTNKAAHEMQERIIATLQELENRGELDEIAKVTQLSKEHLLQNKQKILNDFLNANTKIMTIDKFFTQILRKFSLYASLMPDFSTMNSQHELKLLSRFLKEVSVAGKRNTLITLSLESKKRLGDIFNLLDEFYVKRQELSHLKFSTCDFKTYEDEAMQHFEKLQNIILTCENASSTAINGVTANDFNELCKKSWIAKESLNYRTFSKCYTPEMDEHLENIQECIKKHAYAKEQNFFYALNELVDIYEKSKKALYIDDGELSFNDVTLLVYHLLKGTVDSEFLYFRLDAEIEHILLDEFQDTSIMQYEILKPLIDEIVSGEGVFNNGSFFFVGDTKQSIYRFRGGVSALFDTVRDECNTHTQSLLTNYRSQKQIINFVNETFKNKIKDYENQKVRDEANGGYVEILSSEEILQETLNQTKRIISLGANINDIAILCATNGDGEEIKQLLQKEKIEVVTETTTKLINQKSIKALLEYLKYLYFLEEIYKHNFFALISQEEQDIGKIDLNKVKLLDIIKNVIDKYGLFSNDFNLIRFLDEIARYQDIEALLYEYERLDTSSAASDIKGVRVLTIHKSKGLEYEHVVVMDRLKRTPPARDAIIYEYDNIKLKDIFLRTSKREALDTSYENAISKEKTLSKEDSLNALYVAFTRAKQSLFIISKPKDSIFDILELTYQKKGELKFEEKTDKQEKSSYKPLEYQSLSYGTQSNIIEKKQDQDEDNLKAINFGLALHYMLEMLDSFNIGSIKDAKNMMINKCGHILEAQEIQDIENRVLNLINNQEFQEITKGECYREKALKYKNNLRYIDLLVQKENGSYNIIDYKSAYSDTDKYKNQITAYKNAIEEITGEKTKGYLCFILKQEIKILSL